MDNTNHRLLAMVLSDPRIHLQDIAERLGISKQAVHHRMHALAKAGIYQGTVAGISFAYLNAVPVAVFGLSKGASIENTMNLLGESEFTRRVVVAGGNYVYVSGVLRSLSELDKYAEFVKHAAGMPDPIVGIYDLEEVPIPDYPVDGIQPRKRSYRKLSPLDMRIIASLKEDARKPIAEIAEIVGVTTKTAKKCLESMIEDGSIEFHALVDTPFGGNMLSLMHISLRRGSDKGEVAKWLVSKYKRLDTYVRAFSNIPDFLVMVFWSDDLREIRTVFKETCEERDFVSATLNIAYLERIYSTTWRDKLLDSPAVTRGGNCAGSFMRSHTKSV